MTVLRPLLERYAAAVFEKNAEAFASIFEPEVRVFDMWARWSHDGLGPWREMAIHWFDSLGDERVVVKFDEVQESTCGDMAFATAFITFTAVSARGEVLRSLQNRLTWVARNRSEGWRIVHEHTSSPVDHATGKVILRR